MKWFGRAYGCSYEADCPHVATPIGQLCAHCTEPFTDTDVGVILNGVPHDVPYHYECHFRGIVGGVNHQLGKCICCGGTEPPDPPELTPRAAAIAAVLHWEKSRGGMVQ